MLLNEHVVIGSRVAREVVMFMLCEEFIRQCIYIACPLCKGDGLSPIWWQTSPSTLT